jgi:hypothetical protein
MFVMKDGVDMLYISYGLNTNPVFFHQVCPGAKCIDKGILVGYELTFQGRKGNYFDTLEESEHGYVPVVLWQVSKTDELALERYMGSIWDHQKKRAIVSCSGKNKYGYIYIMNGGEKGFPSQDQFNCIQRGYEYAGFDISLLHEALRRVNPEKYEQARRIVLNKLNNHQPGEKDVSAVFPKFSSEFSKLRNQAADKLAEIALSDPGAVWAHYALQAVLKNPAEASV